MIFIGNMSKILPIITLSLLLASTVLATDLWFTWSPNPTNEMVVSYVIQQANLPNTNYFDVVTAPGTTNVWPVRGLTTGGYGFRLVAVNGAGRSVPSLPIYYPTNVPSQPSTFQFTNAPSGQ